jgi:hypothetical protein
MDNVLLALTASNFIYGVAYTLQFSGVILTIASLWSIRKRFRGELYALWASTPDPVVSWISVHRQMWRAAFERIQIKLHLKHPTVVSISAHDSMHFSDSATASVVAGSPARFDPNTEIGPQFDTLAELVRITRQSVMDVDRRLQETINSESRERTLKVKELDDKMRAVSFGGFGLAALGAALLVVSVMLEIAANFV